MNAHLAKNELGIYIDTCSQEPIFLHELIKNQFLDDTIPQKLSLVITVAPNICITLVDDLISDSGAATLGQLSHTIRLVVCQNSTVRFDTKVVRATSGRVWPFETPITSAPQGERGTVRPDIPQSTIIEKEVICTLSGQYAQATITCSCHCTGNTIFKYTTRQEHCQPHTTSSVTLKGVLDNNALVNNVHTIHVAKAATKTRAEQTSKHILLSKDARAICVPQLEIYNNDVACKHGAAVSSFAQDEIFYLQSRGMDEKEVKQALIKAFLK